MRGTSASRRSRRRISSGVTSNRPGSISASTGALLPPAESPFRQPFVDGPVRVGNRFCVLPMEGWDGTTDGEPSELTRRRWQRFGASGAKLIWGGEAVAVRHDGRANPNQLLMSERNEPALASLRDELVAAHRERFGSNADGDLYLGLQLTHSGRFSRPNVWNRPEPLAAHVNPVLDKRFPGGVALMTDEDIDRLIDDFIDAARRAYAIGFQFVDIKHCHGYFGHELLSARDRDGRYGGSLENRTRFLFAVADGIRAAVPGPRHRRAAVGHRQRALSQDRRRAWRTRDRPPPAIATASG